MTHSNDGRPCVLCNHPDGECLDTSQCPHWSQEKENAYIAAVDAIYNNGKELSNVSKT